jgi:hypothetical protein
MPNIALRTHEDCSRLTTGADGKWTQDWWGQPGDVRRCVHGHLQVRTQVGPNARVAGPGTDWWRTLSPIFTPVLYRRAKRALA